MFLLILLIGYDPSKRMESFLLSLFLFPSFVLHLWHFCVCLVYCSAHPILCTINAFLCLLIKNTLKFAVKKISICQHTVSAADNVIIYQDTLLT